MVTVKLGVEFEHTTRLQGSFTTNRSNYQPITLQASDSFGQRVPLGGLLKTHAEYMTAETYWAWLKRHDYLYIFSIMGPFLQAEIQPNGKGGFPRRWSKPYVLGASHMTGHGRGQGCEFDRTDETWHSQVGH